MSSLIPPERCIVSYQGRKHWPTVVCTRPWRRLFRKTYVIRCRICSLRISE